VKRSSKRFSESGWTQYLVPAVLVLLAAGLLGTFLVVILSLLGVFSV